MPLYAVQNVFYALKCFFLPSYEFFSTKLKTWIWCHILQQLGGRQWGVKPQFKCTAHLAPRAPAAPRRPAIWRWHHTVLEDWDTTARHLGPLLLVGELSAPQDAVLGRDQQEAVSAVQRPRRRLHQAHLDMPPTCRHRNQRSTQEPEHKDGNKIDQIFYDLWCEWASGCCREDKTRWLLRRRWRFLSG